MGAALLAGVGAGIYKDVKEACDRAIQVFSVQDPIKKTYLCMKNSMRFTKASILP